MEKLKADSPQAPIDQDRKDNELLSNVKTGMVVDWLSVTGVRGLEQTNAANSHRLPACVKRTNRALRERAGMSPEAQARV
jgi:hypothetical protein